MFVTVAPEERDLVGYIHSDVVLSKFFQGRYQAGRLLPYLVGAGLHQPTTHPSHIGAVYQDRQHFESVLTPGAYQKLY
jgi:hypothetical protein